MGFFEHRGADAFRAKQAGQAREGFREPRRIAERGFKKMELLEGRFGRLRLERDGNDRRLGSKIFEMRVQHPKERVDVVRRLRDLEPVRVIALVAERNFELQLAGYK